MLLGQVEATHVIDVIDCETETGILGMNSKFLFPTSQLLPQDKNNSNAQWVELHPANGLCKAECRMLPLKI